MASKKSEDFLEADRLVRKALKLLYKHVTLQKEDHDLRVSIGHIQSGIDSLDIPDR